MMDITFYSQTGAACESVELSRGLYSELAQSEFSKISVSQPTKLVVDNQSVELQLDALTPDIRHKLMMCLVREIVRRSTTSWLKIRNGSMTDDGLEDALAEVESLRELLEVVEDDRYYYMAKY